jgi:uncharacterized protein YkwD/LysM repeat protein
MKYESSPRWGGVLTLLAVGILQGRTAAAAPLTLAHSQATAVIGAVNSLRTTHGLQPYSINSILMGTAQAQAEYMASIGTWSHNGPGGLTVTQRLLAAGYPLAGDLSLGGFRSENVVMGSGMTPPEAVASWTGDSIHLHTMLSPDLLEIGAGIAEKEGIVYYVIDCARPTSGGVPQAYTPGAEAAYSAGLSQIIVRVVRSTANASGDIIHEVKAGQSLWQIAIEYGVKIDEIRRLNQLSTAYVINPGDTLLVKKVGTATAAPPTGTPPFTLTSLRSSTTAAEPTLPARATATPTKAQASRGGAQAGQAVGAIVLAALVAAALVAWAGRARPI